MRTEAAMRNSSRAQELSTSEDRTGALMTTRCRIEEYSREEAPVNGVRMESIDKRLGGGVNG